MSVNTFASLDSLVTHLRQELNNKKFILLYAYNGTGKTRDRKSTRLNSSHDQI